MAEKFSEIPVLAYRRCKNLRDLIGSNKISNNKVVEPTRNPGNVNHAYLEVTASVANKLIKRIHFQVKSQRKLSTSGIALIVKAAE